MINPTRSHAPHGNPACPHARPDCATQSVQIMQETSERSHASVTRPVLIYDGDCGFCGYWARYWQKLTQDRVEYRTYQEAAADHPTIPTIEFQRAVQFITPNGNRTS